MWDTLLETIDEWSLVKLEIHQDPEPPDPRKDYDHIGTMVCSHRNYNLGDVQVKDSKVELPLVLMEQGVVFRCSCGAECDYDGEDYYHDPDPDSEDGDYVYEHDGELIAPDMENVVILPLYLMDHSGISMSTSSRMFSMCDSAGWDWGMVGIIFVTLTKMREEWKDLSDAELAEKAVEILELEVKEYDQYLTGDIYGFVVEPKKSGFDCHESCWGFYGQKAVESEGRAVAEYCQKELEKELIAQSMKVFGFATA